jgi:hypothetical protein
MHSLMPRIHKECLQIRKKTNLLKITEYLGTSQKTPFKWQVTAYREMLVICHVKIQMQIKTTRLYSMVIKKG